MVTTGGCWFIVTTHDKQEEVVTVTRIKSSNEVFLSDTLSIVGFIIAWIVGGWGRILSHKS